MASISLADQLDDAIEMMIAEPDSAAPKVDLKIGDLLGIAAELRLLPDPQFKAALGATLAGQSSRDTSLHSPANSNGSRARSSARVQQEKDLLPTLFGAGWGSYPVQPGNFGLSLALHAMLIAVVASAGTWVVGGRPLAAHATATLVTDISSYLLPASMDASRGGGGGGDQDRLPASKGILPRFAEDQITPPAIVVRNEQPKLAVEPTVVGPPSLSVPPNAPTGDPLSAFLQPSNGPGFGGGMGSGSGSGIGSGYGPGVGPGYGGGIGGGIYRVGGGVSAPHALYAPDPQYSDEARHAKFQGMVVLWVIVGADGKPHDVRVARSLGMGLDEKAIDAVRQWKFDPAMKDGHPVAVQVNIEVDFRLY
jgi:protein TonB